MSDRYASFAELARGERGNGSYRIRLVRRPGETVILAPHGGGIEPGTSELAEAIAGQEHSFYAFEGLKSRGNRDLHVTSTRFDEPEAVALVAAARRAIAIHGERSSGEIVYVGGRDDATAEGLRAAFAQRGFRVERHPDPALQGRDVANICNRTASGLGVQLELSAGLRKTFFASLTRRGRTALTPRCLDFVAVVHLALEA